MSTNYKLTDIKTESGFYELSIQVCPIVYEQAVKDYYNYFLSLQSVIVNTQSETYIEGALTISKKELPIQCHITTHEDELGINYYWISILCKPIDIENVFGEEYEVWAIEPKVPQELETYFDDLAYLLYLIYPYKLAMQGFEIRNAYTINSMAKNAVETSDAKCYTGVEHYAYILPPNQKHFTLLIDKATKEASVSSRIASNIYWCFSNYAETNEDVFAREIIKLNSNNNEPLNEIIIQENKIGIVYEFWKTVTTKVTGFSMLPSNDDCGFSTIDLIFGLQKILADKDLGDHVFFEGLQPFSNNDINPIKCYLLKMGS